jgi:hypothetical protein
LCAAQPITNKNLEMTQQGKIYKRTIAAVLLLSYLPFFSAITQFCWEEFSFNENPNWTEIRIQHCEASPPIIGGQLATGSTKLWLPHSTPVGRGLADLTWLSTCQKMIGHNVSILSISSALPGPGTVIAIRNENGTGIDKEQGIEAVRRNRNFLSTAVLAIVPLLIILIFRNKINVNIKQ